LNVKTIFLWSTVLLLCTTIVGGNLSLYYYSQAQSYLSEVESLSKELNGVTMLVNLKLDYGNGTLRWFNSTRVPIDATLLTVSKIDLNANYSVSSLGAFVTSINGVSGDPHHYWAWSYYDKTSRTWVSGPVGSDKWVLHDGDSVAWTYTSY
jgi:hypothetical protein